jgi:glycogen phosphorylase
MSNHHFTLENRANEALTVKNFKRMFLKHLEYTLGKDNYSATKNDLYRALAYAIRDLLVERWRDTQQQYYRHDAKRVYYLSMEFMIGRSLGNSLINLELMDTWVEALQELELDYPALCELEWDAGLGNGGLGRLAACFLDSMATMAIPAYGYGIRYEYGMFYQQIVDGAQVEIADNWLRYSNPWEFDRQEHLHTVKFYGNVVTRKEDHGVEVRHWLDTENVMAMAYDVPVPGYGNGIVNTMRLWSAKATREFDLHFFIEGKYIEAVQKKMRTETISKVLYPADNFIEGRELRLKQEYFLASATIQDILYRFRKKHTDITLLPQKVAIQLNDTHPTLAIAELMRILLTHDRLDWQQAWELTLKTFAYTNHTVLPEALESWPVWLLGKILPHHLQIIYDINKLFLDEVQRRFPGDAQRLQRMSIIEEGPEQTIRMAHLAIVGSHSVNGVSELHTEILKTRVFNDFFEMYPEKFNNKTNGITPRRWLKHANPGLSRLISRHIGDTWITNLEELHKLRPLADDRDLIAEWRQVKLENKTRLAQYIARHNHINVSTDSMFDCQVKRIHEYKRQLLNVLHIVTLYNLIKQDPADQVVPRTFIFSGKAAPSYFMAKLVIKLINAVGNLVNNDPDVRDRLKVVFLANYDVSLAEIIFPAADLSEQISTAGTEASGTGNMKFALNGALTIGTMDGANIEIRQEVGPENFLHFGLQTGEIVELRKTGYNPREIYHRSADLKQALDMIADGSFSPATPDLFKPLVESLLDHGDRYLVLADFASYQACQIEAGRLFLDQPEWTRRCILNSAGMGRFSSDRTIAEYARDIWNIAPDYNNHKAEKNGK